MLRVTISQNHLEFVTLKIEGKLAGKRVSELHRAWQDFAPSLGSRRLSVDLRGATFVDAAGKRALAEIHSETGATFLADTPLTKYFAEQAQQDTRANTI
jgi:anti-anti-sigma regulatory factor